MIHKKIFPLLASSTKQIIMLLVGLVSFLSSNAQELHLGATVAGEINTPSENKAKLGYSVGINPTLTLQGNFKEFFFLLGV